jgi:hypothetical protein
MYQHPHFLHRLPLRSAVTTLLALVSVSACSHQPAEYFWSNADSGEYLFEFDTRACGEFAQHTTAGNRETHGASESPAFFSCMQDRGYVLVDPKSGRPLAAAVTKTEPALIPSQAGR